MTLCVPDDGADLADTTVTMDTVAPGGQGEGGGAEREESGRPSHHDLLQRIQQLEKERWVICSHTDSHESGKTKSPYSKFRL